MKNIYIHRESTIISQKWLEVKAINKFIQVENFGSYWIHKNILTTEGVSKEAEVFQGTVLTNDEWNMADKFFQYFS